MNKLTLFLLLILTLTQCKSKEPDPNDDIPKDWELVEIFADEVPELNEGGYYALFYNHDRPLKDSFYENNNDDIVAIALADSLILNKSTAIIWVNDTKQWLTLVVNETKGKESYHRVYENKNFNVDLNMRFVERIDGMDAEDMYVYAGKMAVTRIGEKRTESYKVKGGI